MIFRILLLVTLPVVFGAPGNDKSTSDADSNEKYTVDCTKRNFQASQDYCKSKGMIIASFHSDQDFNDAKEKVKCNVYVGATSDGKGNWKWLDGSKWWAYSNNDGLSGTRETCLVWRAVDNKWNDWGTGDDLVGVICMNQGGHDDGNEIGSDGGNEEGNNGDNQNGGNDSSKTDDSSETKNNSESNDTDGTENTNKKDDSSKTDNSSDNRQEKPPISRAGVKGKARPSDSKNPTDSKNPNSKRG